MCRDLFLNRCLVAKCEQQQSQLTPSNLLAHFGETVTFTLVTVTDTQTCHIHKRAPSPAANRERG